MVKLYLDEDMSSRVAQALRSKGFDVLSSHEVGNDGLSDEEQLGYATKEGGAPCHLQRQGFSGLSKPVVREGPAFPQNPHP